MSDAEFSKIDRKQKNKKKRISEFKNLKENPNSINIVIILDLKTSIENKLQFLDEVFNYLNEKDKINIIAPNLRD